MSPGSLSSLTYEVPHPPPWNKFLLGLGINSVCVLLLAITNPQVFTARILFAALEDHHVTLTGPTALTRPEPEPPRLLRTPTHLARIEPPSAETPPTKEPIPIPREPVSPAAEAPVLSTSPPTSLPPEPASEKHIKTDVVSAANTDAATLPPAPTQVQTVAFGDPNGVAAQDTANTVPLTVAHEGAFDLPSGEGQGNGTAESHGTSGTVRSAGFTDTTSSTRPVAPEAVNVQTAGFGSVVVKATHSAQQVQEEPVLQPVEITYKPRPAYTPEARQQRVEGEVLLEVVFTASGSLHVNRVVKGLGYGLDDKAVAAAQHIQFHPARRDGKPYDFAAVVRVVFELSE